MKVAVRIKSGVPPRLFFFSPEGAVDTFREIGAQLSFEQKQEQVLEEDGNIMAPLESTSSFAELQANGDHPDLNPAAHSDDAEDIPVLQKTHTHVEVVMHCLLNTLSQRQFCGLLDLGRRHVRQGDMDLSETFHLQPRWSDVIQ